MLGPRPRRASGGPDYDRADWGWLPWCGPRPAIGHAAAIAIHRLALAWPRDSAVFEPASAGWIRENEVFDSAYAVALRPSTPPSLQLLMLQVLARQHDPNELGALDADGQCPNRWASEYMGTPWPWLELDPGRRASMRPLLTTLTHNRGAPPVLRHTATCLASRLGLSLPPDTRPEDFAVTPACPNQLRITNSFEQGGPVTVVMPEGRFPLWVDPPTPRFVTVGARDTLRLEVDTILLWQGRATDLGCSPRPPQ